MLLSDLVAEFIAEREGSGLFADDAAIEACALAAARFYSAFGPVASMDDVDPPVTTLTLGTDITMSEWVNIRPLFLLYVERIEARVQESASAGGHIAAGRSSTEVAADIKAEEEALPHKSFVMPATTVGIADDVLGP